MVLSGCPGGGWGRIWELTASVLPLCRAFRPHSCPRGGDSGVSAVNDGSLGSPGRSPAGSEMEGTQSAARCHPSCPRPADACRPQRLITAALSRGSGAPLTNWPVCGWASIRLPSGGPSPRGQAANCPWPPVPVPTLQVPPAPWNWGLLTHCLALGNDAGPQRSAGGMGHRGGVGGRQQAALSPRGRAAGPSGLPLRLPGPGGLTPLPPWAVRPLPQLLGVLGGAVFFLFCLQSAWPHVPPPTGWPRAHRRSPHLPGGSVSFEQQRTWREARVGAADLCLGGLGPTARCVGPQGKAGRRRCFLASASCPTWQGFRVQAFPSSALCAPGRLGQPASHCCHLEASVTGGSPIQQTQLVSEPGRLTCRGWKGS